MKNHLPEQRRTLKRQASIEERGKEERRKKGNYAERMQEICIEERRKRGIY